MENKAADYFLSPDAEADDANFRAPARPKGKVTPIIDGVSTYQAIEEAISTAKESVDIALWVFNPETPLQSQRARTSGVTRWKHMLRLAAERGVSVRFLLTDFDPIFYRDLHRNAWQSHRLLVAEGYKLGTTARKRFQVICSLHPATVSRVLAGTILGALISKANDEIAKTVAGLNEIAKGKGPDAALSKFRDMPGLWGLVAFWAKTKTFHAVSEPTIVVHPATHHQKLYLIDGSIAFCGGLDVNTGRIDSPRHRGQLWHDVHCRIDGPAVNDLDRNFVARWNREEPIFRDFVRIANAIQPPFKLTTLARTMAARSNSDLSQTGQALVQVGRTLSVDAPLSIVPRNIRRDIEESYERAIGLASEYVYVENQYLRSALLGDWLLARRAHVPGLKAIIVLPIAPEEVSAPGGPDEITLHGIFLQHELLKRLIPVFGKDLGVYSLVANAATSEKSATKTFHSLQIYVHSKVLIVDDVYAHIGSANANDRSFHVDTELGVSWYHRESVTKLRLTLWNEILGAPKGLVNWKPTDFVGQWDKIAKANTKSPPGSRSGFAVPHDVELFRGKKSDRVPNELAELTNTNPNRAESELPA